MGIEFDKQFKTIPPNTPLQKKKTQAKLGTFDLPVMGGRDKVFIYDLCLFPCCLDISYNNIDRCGSSMNVVNVYSPL